MTLVVIYIIWKSLAIYPIFSIALLWFLWKRFDKPMLIPLQRVLYSLACVAIILFTFMTVIDITFDIKRILTDDTTSNTFIVTNAFFALASIGLILIFFCQFWKPLWLFVSKDTNTIKVYWYKQKFFFLHKNERNPKRAYEHLQKMSELKPDDPHSWSMMSLLNEFNFDKPELADVFLEKAKQALAACENPTEIDKARVESVTGELLIHRNNPKGIEHLKKACELDPVDFLKVRYEKALEYLDSQDE